MCMPCNFYNLALYLRPVIVRAKVDIDILTDMTKRVLGNYLKMHRKRSGLSQREIGQLLGYKEPWQVSRHERSRTVPPLLAALAYEAPLRNPGRGTIHVGMYGTVVNAIETNVANFENNLRSREPATSTPMVNTQKLEWLRSRKTSK